MINLAIVPEDCIDRASYLSSCNLPDFYMEDFSILGFTVKNLDAARLILIDAGYLISDKADGLKITLTDYTEIQTLKELFFNHGIDAQFSDVADTFYQA